MNNTEKDKLTAGVDIGGTDIKLVLLDNRGEVVAQSKIETNARRGSDQALERLMEAEKSLLASRGIKQQDLHALGIGTAGPLDIARGIVVQAPNLPGWEGTPITEILHRGLEIPIFLENDANLAAFGEHRLGAGQGSDSVICLTLGTGIGGGIIIDGEIFSGALGAGAEPGHITIDKRGALCACGNRGCLEAMASAAAVARMAVEAVKEGRGKIISELAGGSAERVDAETVHKAALKGDADAVEILEKAGRSLGVGIANMINIFAPRTVVVGGGLMKAGNFILEPAKEEALRRSLKAFTQGVSIVPAMLGSSAGAIGAACYAGHKIKGL